MQQYSHLPLFCVCGGRGVQRSHPGAVTAGSLGLKSVFHLLPSDLGEAIEVSQSPDALSIKGGA